MSDSPIAPADDRGQRQMTRPLPRHRPGRRHRLGQEPGGSGVGPARRPGRGRRPARSRGPAAAGDPATGCRTAGGSECSVADGEIDRRALGAVVFADPVERRELEAIVQPWIGERLRARDCDSASRPGGVVRRAGCRSHAGSRLGAAYVTCSFTSTPRGPSGSPRVAAQRGWSAAEAAAREQAQLSLTEKAGPGGRRGG